MSQHMLAYCLIQYKKIYLTTENTESTEEKKKPWLHSALSAIFGQDDRMFRIYRKGLGQFQGPDSG